MTVAPPSSSWATTDAAIEPLRRAGDHRDLVGVATLARVLRAGRGTPVQRGVDVATRGQGLALPPGGLGADDVPGALEPLREARPVGVDLALVQQPQLGQVLAGAGPAVVEQHRLAAVERRRHQTRPVRTEFGGDQVDELGVGRPRATLTGVVQAELVEDQPGRRGQHAVAAGDLLGELAQRGGVDHAARRRRRPTAAKPAHRGARPPPRRRRR